MALKVENLMVFYENVIAVNDIDMRSDDGQIVGVFGANAAGKTSLMHAISGILLDVEKKELMRGGERITVLGSIELDGEEIGHLKPSERARRGVILCPERRRVFGESTVLENLRIGGYLATRAEAAATLDTIFRIFPPLANRGLQRRAAGLLSGGEQQMVAIGRALMAQPKLLLLDEPLLGLSPLMQSSLVQAIRRIRDERGISVVISEQYARPILPIADYAYVIENGALVMEGTGQELRENSDVQSAYFGVP